MPYMTEVSRADQVVALQDAHEAPASADMMMMHYSIKRAGGRPLSFNGVELAMAMSFTPEIPFWYEVNLFQSEAGFVLAIKRFHQDEDVKDLCHGWELGSLDEAISALEGHDAAGDIALRQDMLPAQGSAADYAAAALALKAEIADARAHFAGLVGEFLHDLDEGV